MSNSQSIREVTRETAQQRTQEPSQDRAWEDNRKASRHKAQPAGKQVADSGSRFAAQWQEWHHNRISEIAGEDGPVTLTGTHWISATDASSAQSIQGVPGRWYIASGTVTGIDLGQPLSTTGTLQLFPGEKINDGRLTYTVLHRGEQRALRTFDRLSPRHLAFRTIAAFEPNQRWVLPAEVEKSSEVVDITAADGTIIPTPIAARLRLNIAGKDVELKATDAGDTLRVIFSDGTTEQGVHKFRFLDVDRPGAEGTTVVDFNRSFLPPLAFSPHFLCPWPTESNRLSAPVEAGEKWPVFEIS